MNWQNRIVDHGHESPEQLLANPRNHRRHPKKQKDSMLAILGAVGWVQSVIVNRRTGFLVDGHLRVETALRAGADSVPVCYVELSENDENLILAAFDAISAQATVDFDQLNGLLQDTTVEEQPLIDLLNGLLRDAMPADDGKGSGAGQGPLPVCPQCGYQLGGD